METVPSERPKSVTVIGWTLLVLAVLRVLNNIAVFFYWRFGGLAETLPMLGANDPGSPLYVLHNLSRNLGPFLIVQTGVAAFVAITAWKLLQLRPWARTAMEAICWIGLCLLAACLTFFFAVWRYALKGVTGPSAAQMLLAPVIAGAIAVFGAGLLGAVIWFLRRPDVRSAFNTSARGRDFVQP